MKKYTISAHMVGFWAQSGTWPRWPLSLPSLTPNDLQVTPPQEPQCTSQLQLASKQFEREMTEVHFTWTTNKTIYPLRSSLNVSFHLNIGLYRNHFSSSVVYTYTNQHLLKWLCIEWRASREQWLACFSHQSQCIFRNPPTSEEPLSPVSCPDWAVILTLTG